MDIVFLGGEVPSHRKLLVEAGVKHIGINYWRLVKRGLPKNKEYILSERFPDDVYIYLTGGAPQADDSGMSNVEIEDFAADYEEFVALNDQRLFLVQEFDSEKLGPVWVEQQRRSLWDEFDPERFLPIWDFQSSHAALFALAERYPNVGILGDDIEEDLTLSARVRAMQSQFQTRFHGIACAKPDNLRQVPLATASTLAWVAPMIRGETIVWDGTQLVRYQKKQKDQARPRYKAVIERAGLDFDAILADDSNEVTKLAVWSYLQLERHLSKNNLILLSDNSDDKDDPGSSETGGVAPDNSVPEVRNSRNKISVRDASEMTTLPVFSVNTKTVIDKDEAGRDTIRDVPILETTGASLRQCNTCFVAANCPAMKPNSSCAFNLPVEVKTKEQLKGLLNAIIEMQGARVAFARFSEELNGGYPDPNTSQEIDRLFKIVKQLKELEENKEFIRITAERQTSGGVLSALFGDRASVLKELPNDGLSEEETTRIISDSLEN